MSDLFSACFSCYNNFILSQSSSGSVDKRIPKSGVFEVPDSETFKPGDLGSFISVLSQVDFYLELLHQNSFLLQITH